MKGEVLTLRLSSRSRRVSKARTSALKAVTLGVMALSLSSSWGENYRAEGCLASHNSQNTDDQKRIRFSILVDDEGRWRMQLDAIDRNVNYKSADVGYDGTNTYAIGDDWNGGKYVGMKSEVIPYAGAWDEMPPIWCMFVLPRLAKVSHYKNFDDPFSRSYPRPLVGVVFTNALEGEYCFYLVPHEVVSTDRHPIDKIERSNPVAKCVVLETLSSGNWTQIPKRFKIALNNGGVGGEIKESISYTGVVTNVAFNVSEKSIVPPMPHGGIVTLIDSRPGFQRPIVIGAFNASGAWPDQKDYADYSEYRQWLGAYSEQKTSLAFWPKIVLLTTLILPGSALLLFFKRRNRQERTERV